MKIIIAISAAILTTLASTAGNAANLNVLGSVSANPCTVTIAGGNKFNFGTIKTEDLNPTEPTHFNLSKVIRVNCPAPIGLFVSFPFDNNGELLAHGAGHPTGKLDWWSEYQFGVCLADLPEEERVTVDDGDGTNKFNRFMAIIENGHVPVVAACNIGYFPNLISKGGIGEDGRYIGSRLVKTMNIPRTLRMTINPRNELDTSGAIQLRGGAVVMINYL